MFFQFSLLTPVSNPNRLPSNCPADGNSFSKPGTYFYYIFCQPTLKKPLIEHRTSKNSTCGPHPHYDAHPLALIGEGEYLQDSEVQYLASRGP